MKFDDLRLTMQLNAMDSVMDKIDESCDFRTVDELKAFIYGLEKDGAFFSVRGDFFLFGDDEKEEITLDDIIDISKEYIMEDMTAMPMSLVMEIVNECFVKYQDFVIEVEEVYTNPLYTNWEGYKGYDPRNDVWW